MVIVHGVDKHKFQKFRDYNVSQDALDAFIKRKDGAIAGATVARRKNWKVGQQGDLRKQLEIAFTITGIFSTGNEEQDNAVLTGFQYAQDSRGLRGWANVIYVKLRGDVRAEAVAAAIDAMTRGKGAYHTNTQAEKTFMSSMLEDLDDMMKISRTVIMITLFVVLAGIANTISMSVRDRTQQIGVMRTLGYSRRSILSLVMAESALISVFGGILGVIVAFAVLHLRDITVQTRTYNFAVSLNWIVVLIGLGIALLVGFAGGLLPAFSASRLKIVDALRSVD